MKKKSSPSHGLRPPAMSRRALRSSYLGSCTAPQASGGLLARHLAQSLSISSGRRVPFNIPALSQAKSGKSNTLVLASPRPHTHSSRDGRPPGQPRLSRNPTLHDHCITATLCITGKLEKLIIRGNDISHLESNLLESVRYKRCACDREARDIHLPKLPIRLPPHVGRNVLCTSFKQVSNHYSRVSRECREH